MTQATLGEMNTMLRAAIARAKREYPQLVNVLKEPPCYFCHVTVDANGHCNSEYCPELTAWLMETAI